jgi:sialic acid synthase SpsE
MARQVRRVIAKIGSVHDGSFGNASKLIEVAAACGADTVRCQTHLPEVETLCDAPSPTYFKGESRFDYFPRAGFSVERWRGSKAKCEEAGVTFLSAPISRVMYGKDAAKAMKPPAFEAYCAGGRNVWRLLPYKMSPAGSIAIDSEAYLIAAEQALLVKR